MDIRKHIKELLFLHDCVIIPGFGGFVTSYQSAEIQRFKNVIYPPSKSLLFNRRLISNDGILVNHVAQKEKIDYRTAEESVRQSADAWNRLIDSRGMLLFPDIGKLYINSSNTLVFLPELRKNYLTETFGLKPIAYYTSEPKSAKIIEMERKKNVPVEESESTGKKTKSNTGKWVAVAAVFLILLLLIPQMFLQNRLPENLRIQQLNIMHFFTDSAATDKTEVKKEAIEPESTVSTTETDSASGNNFSETSEPVAESSEETGEPQNPGNFFPSSGNFYIVFGESDFMSDAVRLKKQLDAEHGKTFEIFSSADGYAVGLRAGESQEQAEASLGYFRSGTSGLKVVVRE